MPGMQFVVALVICHLSTGICHEASRRIVANQMDCLHGAMDQVSLVDALMPDESPRLACFREKTQLATSP